MKQVFILLFGVMVSMITPLQAQAEKASIVGVWQLDELTNYNADGSFFQPFGTSPSGTFIYTPDGNLSIQIMKTPPPDKYEGRPNDTQRLQAARGYLAYFGTYEFDSTAMAVTHNVKGAINPNYVDTSRERDVSINGATLEIEINFPDGRRAYRRLTRTERFQGAHSIR